MGLVEGSKRFVIKEMINVANNSSANKWLILIAYLMGISIGVHLLNLLAPTF